MKSAGLRLSLMLLRAKCFLLFFLLGFEALAQADKTTLLKPESVLEAPKVTSSSLLAESFYAALQMLTVLGLVLLLAYLVLNKGLGWFVKKNNVGKKITLKEKRFLDTKKALYLVEVEGRNFLLGASDSGIQLISEMRAEKNTHFDDRLQLKKTHEVSNFYDDKTLFKESQSRAES